jgi:hypothetical protein
MKRWFEENKFEIGALCGVALFLLGMALREILK